MLGTVFFWFFRNFSNSAYLNTRNTANPCISWSVVSSGSAVENLLITVLSNLSRCRTRTCGFGIWVHGSEVRFKSLCIFRPQCVITNWQIEIERKFVIYLSTELGICIGGGSTFSELSTGWRSVVSFTHRPFFAWGKQLQYRFQI
jgi:hypothetical protein